MDAAEHYASDAAESTTPQADATDQSGSPGTRVVVAEQDHVGRVVFEADGALYPRLSRVPAMWTVIANTVRAATESETAEAARVRFRRLTPYSAPPLESLGPVRHADGSPLGEAL